MLVYGLPAKYTYNNGEQILQMPLPSKVRLFLGIGNPGEEFENTYHNAGLLALETLASRDGVKEFQKVSRKHFARAKGNTFLFIRSLTFMNESGISAEEACALFNINPEELVVLHDESDLSLGRIQFAFGKGPAGHKGVASIAQALGTNDFWRIRIGIRKPEELRRKASEFVLSKISKGDKILLSQACEKIGDSLNLPQIKA